jgi:hypothetical protein
MAVIDVVVERVFAAELDCGVGPVGGVGYRGSR